MIDLEEVRVEAYLIVVEGSDNTLAWVRLAHLVHQVDLD